MARGFDEEFDWQPFIGRSLAFLCLDKSDVTKGSVLERAEFLMKMGLPRKEAALVVGSTDDSLRVLLARQKSAATPARKKKA